MLIIRKRETMMIWKKLKISVEQRIFPKRLARIAEKASFRRNTKWFSIKYRQLYYKEDRRVIADKDCQVDIIHDIDQGLGDTSHSKAKSAHLGRTPT